MRTAAKTIAPSWLLWKATCVLLGLELMAAIYTAQSWYRFNHQPKDRAISAQPTIHHLPAYFIRPQHYEILRKAGWAQYVTANIEVLIYLDDYSEIEQSRDEKNNVINWVGASLVVDGKLTSYVTTKGRPDVEIARTLVHEATHLHGWVETNGLGYGSEVDAQQAAKKFLDDYTHTVGNMCPDGTYRWVSCGE